MLDDFIFDGKDIETFGATAAFGQESTWGSGVERMAYELAGGGEIIFDDPQYTAITRSVTITPRDGVTDTPAWRRAIIGWLMRRQGRLILKREMDVYRMARFDDAPTVGSKAWPFGAITIKCRMAGLSHAVRPWSTSAATSGGAASIALTYPTGLAAPLGVTIACTSGTITAATIGDGARTLALGGLALTGGQEIVYRAGDGTQGEMASLTIAGAAGFGNVTRWAQLMGAPGGTLTIRLTGGEASLKVSARGRWID